MNVLKRNAVIVAALYAVTTPLLAQTSLDSLQHLPEVVVTERYGDREIRSSAPMRILLRKSIRNLNALQLSDVVKHFPGVTVKDFGGIGGLKAVSVRSLGASHTAVNYNGFTINDIQTGQIDIGRFALDNVDMISLNSGQSDNIFQPARLFASASVLNIQSAAPQVGPGKKVNGRASLKAGSFGMFNPAVSTNLKLNEKLSASLSGEWLSANGEYPYILHYGEAGRDSSSVEKRENTDVKNLRLEGALFANFSDKSSGNLRTYYYQSERGLPGATILYNTSGFSKQRLRDNTFFTQAHYFNNLSGRWALQVPAKRILRIGFCPVQGVGEPLVLGINGCRDEQHVGQSTGFCLPHPLHLTLEPCREVRLRPAPGHGQPALHTDIGARTVGYGCRQPAQAFPILQPNVPAFRSDRFPPEGVLQKYFPATHLQRPVLFARGETGPETRRYASVQHRVHLFHVRGRTAPAADNDHRCLFQQDQQQDCRLPQPEHLRVEHDELWLGGDLRRGHCAGKCFCAFLQGKAACRKFVHLSGFPKQVQPRQPSL